MPLLDVPKVAHRSIEVDGIRVVYREAGPPDAPTMLLLHGFPSASHQFRRLIDALGSRYRLIAPDGWTLDQHFLDLPGRKQIQADLAFDYHTNVERYPRWQAWLRRYQPPTLIVWGRNDPFFLEAGARAHLRDLPAAELHLFETEHFALEECLGEMAPLIASFLDRVWR
jgi:pimeloyl-ACP methyl ester carboxylesterase